MGLLLLKNAVLDDATCPEQLYAIVFFTSNVFVSVASRRLVTYSTAVQNSPFLYRIFILALIEFASRLVVYTGHVFRQVRYLSQLNKKTLCELIDACQAAERARGLTMTVLLVSQCAEICVVVLITMQNATMPVWTQHTLWLTYDTYQARFLPLLAVFAIQLLMEMLVDWLFQTCIYRSLEGHHRFYYHGGFYYMGTASSAILQRFVLNRYMVVCAISVVAYMSIAFWPMCSRCDDPINCLAFTECLRSGVIDVNGDNYCVTYPRNMTNMRDTLLAISHPFTNVSYDHLGCDRTPRCKDCTICDRTPRCSDCVCSMMCPQV